MMDDENVKRMPVVDEQHRLIGIITRRDLLSLYLRDDHEIRKDIVNNVLLRAMWMDPSTVDVAVDRGLVTLSGTIDRRSTGEIIVQLCTSVAGVVNVASQLMANYDDTDDLRRHGFMGATVKETIPWPAGAFYQE